MKRLLSDPTFVGKTPLLAVALLEVANVQQLYHMWSHWTAAGQSLTGWITVNIALWLWLNFYRVITPQATYAIWGTRLGILMNSSVIATVAFFRYAIS